MNARRVKGDGDDAQWELPQTDTPLTSRKSWRWQTIAGVLGATAAIVGILGFFKIGPSEIYSVFQGKVEICDPDILEPEDYDKCKARGGKEPSNP